MTRLSGAFVEIGADLTGLRQGLGGALATARGAAKTIGASVARFITTPVGLAVLAVGGLTIAFNKLRESARSALAEISQIGRISRELGVDFGEAQRFGSISNISGGLLSPGDARFLGNAGIARTLGITSQELDRINAQLRQSSLVTEDQRRSATLLAAAEERLRLSTEGLSRAFADVFSPLLTAVNNFKASVVEALTRAITGPQTAAGGIPTTSIAPTTTFRTATGLFRAGQPAGITPAVQSIEKNVEVIAESFRRASPGMQHFGGPVGQALPFGGLQ